jgi:hypothetical protein
VLCGQPTDAAPLAPGAAAGRSPTARPPAWSAPLAAATRSVILRLARDNPRWGYMRIRGELLKLGINVSATTIATVLRASRLGPAPRRIGPTWSEFLRAQAQSMLDAGLSWERGGGLEGNVTASSAPIPEGAAGGVEADELSSKGAKSRRPPGCRICRGCRQSPPCLLPAIGRPRHGHRSSGMHAMDQGHAGALCARHDSDGRQGHRLLAAGVRVATARRVSWAAARLFSLGATTMGRTLPSWQVNRVSLPHRLPPAAAGR